MATMSIIIPDQHVQRVIHALCTSAGLPESPANAKEAVLRHIRAVVRNVEMIEAQAAIQATDAEGIVS